MSQSSSGIKSKKLGGSIASAERAPNPVRSSNTWVKGISSQLHTVDSNMGIDDDLDVRAVPIDLICIDPTNPRELDIEPTDLRDKREAIQLPDSAFGDDDSWIDEYEKRIRELFGDNKKSDDCMNIALFAASIKSPKNLLAPICTWREETTFYLFAGERRYLAHFFFDSSQAITRVWPNKPSRFEMKLLEWQENHEREDLTLAEKITNMRQILVEWGKANPGEKMTVRKFGRIVSIGRTRAALWYKVAKCEDGRFNDALKIGGIGSIETASELAGLKFTKLQAYLDRLEAGEKITKDLILKETKNISTKTKSRAPRGTFQINSKANLQPVIYIVQAALEKIDSPELSRRIDTGKLQKPKDITAALTAIVEYLEND